MAFQVWLLNRLLSAGLEPVLSQTEKSCIASNYRQLSADIKMKNFKIKSSINLVICNLIFVENWL